MKIVRIDLQGACEPMEFKSKKALKEYLIDFHLQDYHEEDEHGVGDIKLIKSFSLNQICDYFGWGYEQTNTQKGYKMKKNKNQAYTVRMTKDYWYYADVYASSEKNALKVAEQMHNEGKLDIHKNDNQEGDWHYDFADLNNS